MKGEAKWDLLDRIQENTEGWENDKGRKLGINYDYALQGFLSIATKIITTTIFCCNKMRYYHKIHGRGNRIHILPQLTFLWR
jgi:hypothetical protein